MDFEILPPDPAWNAAEVSNIKQEINGATNAGECGRALRRLARVDTPASVQALIIFI